MFLYVKDIFGHVFLFLLVFAFVASIVDVVLLIGLRQTIFFEDRFNGGFLEDAIIGIAHEDVLKGGFFDEVV